MNQASVNHLICAVRQVNGMLQILDAEKDNPSITLGELQQRFASQFCIHPTAENFAFYNQHQFLTSLLAYLCMPSEKFYAELPETRNCFPAFWLGNRSAILFRLSKVACETFTQLGFPWAYCYHTRANVRV
jgi:hypothetical protein